MPYSFDVPSAASAAFAVGMAGALYWTCVITGRLTGPERALGLSQQAISQAGVPRAGRAGVIGR